MDSVSIATVGILRYYYIIVALKLLYKVIACFFLNLVLYSIFGHTGTIYFFPCGIYKTVISHWWELYQFSQDFYQCTRKWC